MTEHLPECEAYRDECGGGCICHHVRACEERVWETAREAVKRLQHSDECYYREGVLCHCEIKRVIAAIDALRKETND